MSAATVFPEILDPNLQKLAFAVLTSIRYASGTAAAGFIDRLGNVINAQSNLSGGQPSGPPKPQNYPNPEVEITIRINPDGLSAVAKVIAQTPAGVQSVEGALDPSLLAGQTWP
jgi:hypothetical protein